MRIQNAQRNGFGRVLFAKRFETHKAFLARRLQHRIFAVKTQCISLLFECVDKLLPCKHCFYGFIYIGANGPAPGGLACIL
ncbi:MAG: hypothetical protein RSE54_11340, partial [Ruthenibacterium sp.]